MKSIDGMELDREQERLEQSARQADRVMSVAYDLLNSLEYSEGSNTRITSLNIRNSNSGVLVSVTTKKSVFLRTR